MIDGRDQPQPMTASGRKHSSVNNSVPAETKEVGQRPKELYREIALVIA